MGSSRPPTPHHATQSRRTHLRVLRSLQPLACCLRSFSESCASLDAASSGAAAAAFYWFSWKQHLFLDARHQHRCLAAVQQHVWRLKQKRVRLTPGSIPAHADPSAGACRLGMASKALQMCLFYASPAVLAEHVTSDTTCSVSHGPQHTTFVMPLSAASCLHVVCSETQMPYPTFHIPIPIPLPK